MLFLHRYSPNFFILNFYSEGRVLWYGKKSKMLSLALIIAILAGMVNFVYVFAENEGQAESGSQASTGGFEISVKNLKIFMKAQILKILII